MENLEAHRSEEYQEKPAFLYHGTVVPGIPELKPRKRYMPGGRDVPEAIYAGDLPAFAAAHSFPWGTNEGFELYVEQGKVILRVPGKFKERLGQRVYIYTVPSDGFELTGYEGTGHTYCSQECVRPTEVQEFDSVQEAVEHFGGEVSYTD